MSKQLPIIFLVAAIVVLIGIVGLQYGRKSKPADKLVTEESVSNNETATGSGGATSYKQAEASDVTTDSKGTIVNQIALIITSPANNTTVTSPTITVRGKTSPRAEVAVNETETVADASGNFSVNVVLDEDDNIIIVVANDTDGNVAEQELIVTYTP